MDAASISIVVGSIFTGLCGLLTASVALVKARKTQTYLDNLTKKDLDGYFINCPKCGKRVYLNAVVVYKEAVKAEKED